MLTGSAGVFVGVLVGVLVGVGSTATRPTVNRATKASVPPLLAACAPPVVPGKFVEDVNPATYTSPEVGWIARAKASSKPPPPRYVA